MMSVGEKPTVIPFTINSNARIPKQRQKDTMKNLDTAQFCYIGSGIGWVSTLLYNHIIISRQTNKL